MNILLIMADELRTDYTGLYGDTKVPTPNINRIGEGMAFSKCISTNPLCLPARTSLLTGRYSKEIGALTMAGDLDRNIPTYPRALQAAGYYTAGIGKFHFLQGWQWNNIPDSGHNLVELEPEIRKYGFDYVWESDGKQLCVNNYSRYCERLEEKGLLDAFRQDVTARNPAFPHAQCSQYRDSAQASVLPEQEYIDVVIADETIRQIQQAPADRPFFILSSFCGPHEPFDPPQRYLDMFDYEEIDDFIPIPPGAKGTLVEQDAAFKKQVYKYRRAYKAMVACIDEQIGRLFAALEARGILDDTVILFTADHGKMFGDRGLTHKSQPYRRSVNVPLAIRHPSYLRGEINDSPVSLTDVTATILDIAGLNPRQALSPARHGLKHTYIVPGPNLFHGLCPLTPILRGETDSVREYAFSECDTGWQMIQTAGYKYIKYLYTGSPDKVVEELFDTSADPDELHDLSADPAYQEILLYHRRRRDYLADNTPAIQTGWAPIMSQK